MLSNHFTDQIRVSVKRAAPSISSTDSLLSCARSSCAHRAFAPGLGAASRGETISSECHLLSCTCGCLRVP